MMKKTPVSQCLALFGLAVFGLGSPGAATGADVFETVDAVFEAHGFEHPRLAALPDAGLSRRDAAFLVPLFEALDDLIVANANVRRWFASAGRAGLHANDYLERVAVVIAALEVVEPPARASAARSYLVESAALQQGFVKDWSMAIENGTPFVSPLMDENAYHEGLHRSHRLHLKAYAELLAVFPGASETTKGVFRSHLRAVGLR